MSTISDHIIILRQNFIVNLSILIKQSLSKSGGASAPKAPPPQIRSCCVYVGDMIKQNCKDSLVPVYYGLSNFMFLM